MQTIQRHLSQKQKNFSIFSCIFQIYIKFSTYSKKKKDDTQRLCIFEIADPETRA